MSQDRTTELLNYLSAISREVGQMRAELNARLDQVETRLERIEREQKVQGQRLGRIEGFLQVTRVDIEELQDRVSALESKRP